MTGPNFEPAVSEIDHRSESTEPDASYLDWANRGRSSGWLYLAGAVGILAIWLMGSVILALPLVLDPTAIEADGSFDLGAVWLNNLVALITFVPLFVAVPLVVRFVHGRPWQTVITPFRSFSFRLMAIGAGVWSGLLLVSIVFGLLLGTDEIEWVFDPAVFIPNLIVLLALLFIQTTAEELFFRGYLAQWIAKATRSRWILSLAIGAIFTVPHMLNPEVIGLGGLEYLLGISGYFMVGFALTWVCVSSGTIELAVGAHFANNFLVSVLISPENSVLGSASFFAASETDILGTAVLTAFIAIAFILITRRVRGRGELIPVPPMPQFQSQVRSTGSAPMAPPPMGWYQDPYGRAAYRLWNGYYWTTTVAYPYPQVPPAGSHVAPPG